MQLARYSLGDVRTTRSCKEGGQFKYCWLMQVPFFTRVPPDRYCEVRQGGCALHTPGFDPSRYSSALHVTWAFVNARSICATFACTVLSSLSPVPVSKALPWTALGKSPPSIPRTHSENIRNVCSRPSVDEPHASWPTSCLPVHRDACRYP